MSAKDKNGLGYGTQLDEMSNKPETDSEISLSVFEVRSSDEEIIPANDRFSKAGGYHVVPPPITGNFLAPRADISFTSLDEYAIRKKIIESRQLSLILILVNLKLVRLDKVIIRDWNSYDEDDVSKVNTFNPVKTNETQTIKTQVDKIGQFPQKEGIGFKKIKACFVCKSTDHLIKDYDFYAKKSPEPKIKTLVNTGQMMVKPVWDNAKRVNHKKNSNKLKYAQVRRTFVPSGVLTRTCLINPVRPNGKRAVHTFSTARHISTAKPVSTAKPFAPKIAQTGSAIRPIYPRMDNENPKILLQDHAVVDSGCSSHMTGNKPYLFDYEDYNGGFVAFGSDPKGEFKNHAMNEFCAKNGIKREFSVARTPQQNGVAERKNRTLIEKARTMLADSLLPIPFWAEAVNTACYVLNRVLMTKPQNKTPYELLIGYLLGTLPLSKAFRSIQQIGTKRVEENCTLDVSENHKCGRNGPNGCLILFCSPIQLNYIPVSVENQDNLDGDSKDVADKEGQHQIKEDEQVLHDELEKMIAQEVYADLGRVSDAFQVKDIQWSLCCEKVGWVEAMQEELLQFKLQKVWILVDLPYGKKAIGTKWVFKNKRMIELARIEASEEVYVHQPPGFVDLAHPNKVYKVIKALYGLHQAPRAWYETLSSFLMENGFMRGTIDKTLFIKKNKSDIMLVQVYVDDIIFGSTKKYMCTEFEDCMHKRFQMSSMGELTFFLGLQVKQQPDGIFISQDKYAADSLKKFDFWSIRTATTPIESNKPLVKDEDGEDVDVHVYRSMIGSLMYLTASRLDIMFDVCTCARFQVTPKASHLNAVKRIFRYLKHQPKLGLWYPRDSPFELEAFSDSDYGGASLDKKSTIGGCQFLGRRLISWQCKKQTIVANSTTEAEYVAAANCCGQVLWIQNQMMDYGFNFMNTRIHIDNESTISVIKNPVAHSRTKHIEIRFHFIRDCYEKRLIEVIKIHTDSNVADLLTKGFDVTRFNFLVIDLDGDDDLGCISILLEMKIVGYICAEQRVQAHANYTKIRDSLEGTKGDERDQSLFKDATRAEIRHCNLEIKKLEIEVQARHLTPHGHDQDADHTVVEDKSSVDKGGNAKKLVSTVRPELSTARPDIDAARQDNVVEPRTPPTSTSIFDDEDISMAQTLIKMKEEKAKEKGVSIKDVDDSSRTARSILTLKPLPIIDPKDKDWYMRKEASRDWKRQRKDRTETRSSIVDYIATPRLITSRNMKEADFVLLGLRVRDEKLIDKMNMKHAGMDEAGFLKRKLSWKLNEFENQEKWIIKVGLSMKTVGVHILALEDGTEIHMLAERRYPHIRETLERMIELRLIAESEGHQELASPEGKRSFDIVIIVPLSSLPDLFYGWIITTIIGIGVVSTYTTLMLESKKCIFFCHLPKSTPLNLSSLAKFEA
ncbi:putative ribonuclease H-like domain-containing protein, partial [Tanacetum coccineum]